MPSKNMLFQIWSQRKVIRWLIIVGIVGVCLPYLAIHIVDYYQKLQNLPPTLRIIFLGCFTLGILLLGLSGVGLWQLLTQRRAARQKRTAGQTKSPGELSDRQKKEEIQQHLQDVRDLISDPRVDAEQRRLLQEMLQALEAKQAAQKLEIVAIGAISSGKSALLNLLAGRPVFQVDIRGGTTVTRNEVAWPHDQTVVLVDTPGLGEIHGEEHVEISRQAAQNADLVLLVVEGPLRSFEHQVLTLLRRMDKRVVLCVNKADWYSPQDLQLLREQICEQVSTLLAPEDVVVVAAQPVKRRRIRQLPDGQQQEELYEEPPRIDALAERLLNILSGERTSLLLTNLLLQARGLADQARQRAVDSLRQEAHRIVDRYAWAAATAGAISPLPLLDLIASGGLTAKMIIDVAAVFRKDIDLDAAVSLLKQLGKALASTLGVNLVSPAAASVVASLLKSVPGIGTLAGGTLQGVAQLLIVRWAGRVVIQQFANDLLNRPCSLAELAAAEWKRATSLAELAKLAAEFKERMQQNRALSQISA